MQLQLGWVKCRLVLPEFIPVDGMTIADSIVIVKKTGWEEDKEKTSIGTTDNILFYSWAYRLQRLGLFTAGLIRVDVHSRSFSWCSRVKLILLEYP